LELRRSFAHFLGQWKPQRQRATADGAARPQAAKAIVAESAHAGINTDSNGLIAIA
jgi:hypothetical protein